MVYIPTLSQFIVCMLRTILIYHISLLPHFSNTLVQ